MSILDLLNQDGIQLKRMANIHGGEYAGPCPLCGGRDRFRAWPEEGEGGKWWCRGCSKGGDLIQYLRDCRNMSFHEACLFLGKEPEFKRLLDWNRQAKQPEWTPREINSPCENWIKKGSVFVDWAHKQLLSDQGKNTLEYLKNERGLSERAIKIFHLGWNPRDLWQDREVWGLSKELKEDGKPKKLWLPAGIVIPLYVDNALWRVRIRLQKPIKDTTYCFVSGGSSVSMVLRANSKIYIIVESELDGILLHQEIGTLATVIALGNAQTRPDKISTYLLRQSELILVALDDDSGKEVNSGAKESWNFWLKYFSQAKRLPPVYGKDPGEMWKNGITLRYWVEAGLERYQQKP